VSFDRVAPHYRWLETLVFGNQLQQARLAFLKQIASPRRVLIVGEGNGRFLGEFMTAHPHAAVDCVDASGRMIALARARLGKESLVDFIQADIRSLELVPNSYDLIVTHFVLDCFGERTLAALIPKLANSATPHAQWLLADFFQPATRRRKLRARVLVALMYSFFRVVAAIEARYLIDCGPFLQANGFALLGAVQSPDEIVRSEMWQRNPPPG
jgi:ubiquinone/menaquinone biosynthesis C-methylase UbiE